ncbi:MAG TPA: PAS domain-containing protein [Gemmatimonadaceae bacterium]|nr:PAS domain-containing protein [Gemmatimonadaceae bacterium]
MPSLYDLSLLILLLAVLAAGGWLLVQQRRLRRGPPVEETAARASSLPDERTRRRSLALDAVVEAVLIVDREGRVRDCNSHALSLFGRHRAALEGQFVNALRRFEGVDEADVCRVAAERGVWNGEAWARQPDGGVRLCQARVAA